MGEKEKTTRLVEDGEDVLGGVHEPEGQRGVLRLEHQVVHLEGRQVLAAHLPDRLHVPVCIYGGREGGPPWWVGCMHTGADEMAWSVRRMAAGHSDRSRHAPQLPGLVLARLQHQAEAALHLPARAVLGDPLPQGDVVRLQVDLLVLLLTMRRKRMMSEPSCLPPFPSAPPFPITYHLHPLLLHVLLLPALVEEPPAAVARLLVLVPVPVQNVVQPPALLRAACSPLTSRQG